MEYGSPQFLQRRNFFLAEAQRRADSLFSHIDTKLVPQVFILSLSNDENGELKVEGFAGESSWISKVDFSEAGKFIAKNKPELPMRRRLSSANGNVDISFGHIRYCLKKFLNASSANPGGCEFFISHPAQLDKYSACVCLSVDADILEKYPSIDSIPNDTDFSLSPSFMASLIDEFLEKHRIEMNLPIGEIGFESFNFTLESILQQGGRDFVGDIAYRISKHPQPVWLKHIYTVCAGISLSDYELSGARGSILLAPRDADYISHAVKFSGNPKLADIRSTRKLLELTKEGMSLHSDSETVFGLCRPHKRINKSAPCFKIDFMGRNKWQVSHMGRSLLVVSNGIPRLPRSSYETREFSEALRWVFNFKAQKKIDKLVELIQIGLREKKGTILVFSKSAKEEAKRLAPQSTTIAATPLTRTLLASLTPIDGAILIDRNGVCHSIGTILDGMVSLSGDPSRGARYNSAVKYVESRKLAGDVCMAVAISEDGDADIIA